MGEFVYSDLCKYIFNSGEVVSLSVIYFKINQHAALGMRVLVYLRN